MLELMITQAMIKLLRAHGVAPDDPAVRESARDVADDINDLVADGRYG